MVRLVSSRTAMMPGGDLSSMRSQTTWPSSNIILSMPTNFNKTLFFMFVMSFFLLKTFKKF